MGGKVTCCSNHRHVESPAHYAMSTDSKLQDQSNLVHKEYDFAGF